MNSGVKWICLTARKSTHSSRLRVLPKSTEAVCIQDQSEGPIPPLKGTSSACMIQNRFPLVTKCFFPLPWHHIFNEQELAISLTLNLLWKCWITLEKPKYICFPAVFSYISFFHHFATYIRNIMCSNPPCCTPQRTTAPAMLWAMQLVQCAVDLSWKRPPFLPAKRESIQPGNAIWQSDNELSLSLLTTLQADVFFQWFCFFPWNQKSKSVVYIYLW